MCGQERQYTKPLLLKRKRCTCLIFIYDKKGPSVQLRNKEGIFLTQQGKVPLSNHISSISLNVMVLLGLKSSSFVFAGQLCAEECIVGLEKKRLVVAKNEN